MSALQKKLGSLVEPLLASLGLELWGLEFLPAQRSILRIYIEKQAQAAETSAEDAAAKDAGIDECTEAARLIGLTLDVEDLIDGSYVMEVSTPGLERQFFSPEQLAARAGELVDLALHAAPASHPGRKRFAGRVSAQAGRFSLELLHPLELTPEADAPLEFGWEDVKKARLIYVTPEKPNAPKPKQNKQKKAAKQPAAPQE